MKDTEIDFDEFSYAFKVLKDNLGIDKPKIIRVGSAIEHLLLCKMSFISIDRFEPSMNRRYTEVIKGRVRKGEMGIIFCMRVISDPKLKDWSFRIEG